ncbi:MAG: 4-(cytidine 5'-diphospho)-2-C-methyl-D-erythritol kinase [Prevotellaceae bacterium]|jgi:4-diphosphocytidyl-2-C-methyl-D-erythritol kinase|nr:4-(cytidine 5'-diphospho)-2-C-methyl-D-erythritol kinase [Prevotellaceae bacterium]
MISFPCSKINLGLNVISKRDDGYHNIETVFFPVHGLTDVLEIVESDKFSFTQTGINVDSTTENNLCVKAYRILEKDCNLPPVAIYLHKVIPPGAGLGGGSSDAAFTLTVLNKMFELDMSHEQLKFYATVLGSDCAFFIDNVPSKASGRGELLEPVKINISGLYLLIVKPDIHVSTKEAYTNITPRTPDLSVTDIIKLPVEQWRGKLHNDFEKSIFPLHPAIAEIKEKMYEHGALYSSMSGSGASVFGLFSESNTQVTQFKQIYTNYFFLKV